MLPWHEAVFFGDTGLNHLIETKRVSKDCTLSAGGGGVGAGVGGGGGGGASRT